MLIGYARISKADGSQRPRPAEGTVKLTDLVPNQRLGKSLSC